MASLSRLFFFLFFFSSRRRHTRCSRDWSSDVCSSDLVSPDGRRVAYVRDDGKGTSMLRVLDAATGRPLAAHRVNGGVDYDWLGDTLVVTQRSEEHTSELQSRLHLVCRLLLEKKKTTHT